MVRIARTPNELSRKPPVGRSASSELHVSSIPGTAVVKANSRLRDPRTDARPLGRTENFNAPRSSAGSGAQETLNLGTCKLNVILHEVYLR